MLAAESIFKSFGGHRVLHGVSAGFAPGFAGPGDMEPLVQAVKDGVIVVQATRAGSGRTFQGTRLREMGFLIADNLTPQKARILLMLGLTITREHAALQEMFGRY